MQKRVSSVEVADLLIRQQSYMTVAQITCLVQEAYPDMLVNTGIITNILRVFVQSPFAQCNVHPDAYPRQYHLKAMNGYIFKVRGRKEVSYDGLLVESATKQARYAKEQEQRSLCMLARELMDRCQRVRMEKAPLN
ncbi:late promoter activating protein [Enterobacter sp. BRE11]|nr:late promoter activating protein [Enterobacter sp. BRE11]